MENSFNPPPPLPPSAAEQLQPPQQQFSLPPYPEMIMAAIEALNEKNGSNKTSISKHIESGYPTLPPSHATLLSYHLNQLKQSGQLVMLKNNYMKPDPNAPPKRGRGRPPKPKEQLPPGAVAAAPPPRPRGRPPKARDPLAPAAAPPKMKAPSGGTGRPRGRPPKKQRLVESAPAPAPAPAQAQAQAQAQPSGERRGRGRPPKVKPVVAPVGC